MATAPSSHGHCQSLFEGCISSSDLEIRRRPYHRNCGCSLHRSRCLPQDVPCNARVSYPIRKSWSSTSISSLQNHPAADGGGCPLVTHSGDEREEDA